MSNCSYPTNQAVATKTLYSAAKDFETYLAAVAGHGSNMHNSATGASEQIQTFLKNNGL
jgi:hypothetical protein